MVIKRPSRITLVGAAFILAAIAIVVRAVEVQLLHGDLWRRRAAEQQTVRVELPARRGALFDRNGVAIALSQVTYGVGVAPREISDPGRAAGLLAKALGKRRDETARFLASDRVWMADHRAVVPCIALLRRPEDPEFPNAGLYALVRDVPVRDDGGASVCPVAIVLPGATAPPWTALRGQWRSIASVDGPVTIWQDVGR